MKITSFTINNFRSIKTANSINIEDKCVIIGPNNEGKSNILQALALCLSTITGSKRTVLGRTSRFTSDERTLRFDWERDYPIDLQASEPDGASHFKLTLSLTAKERAELSKIIGQEASDKTIFELSFGKRSFKIKSIDGTKDHRKKVTESEVNEYLGFFNQHLSFHYIPAIRPTEYSVNIIENLLAEALSELDSNKEYNDALKRLETLQKPILSSLSSRLTDSIKEFIPEVKKVDVATEETLRRVISRSLNILIEDNAKTSIERKGDGIKSLIAISLVKHSTLRRSHNKSMILALEEPESHLHPAAIHRLNAIINEISQKQQVIITTHSPLLVDRRDISRNVLVNKQKAQQADSIVSIRDTIGVHVSDNLTNSSWVLLVEGKSDERILHKWLSLDSQVKRLLDDTVITIDSLSGGTNFSYKISLFNSMLCNVLFFLDDDDSGKKSFQEAIRKSLIDVKDGVFSIVPGRKESEIEDMIVPEVYSQEIMNRYGVNLEAKKFKTSKKKWSDRLKDLFRDSGKQWDNKIEEEIKALVADCISAYQGQSIKTKSEGPVENLISMIKQRCVK
jgi:putative ATP-dependent endonuclease of the OLD family